MGSKPAISSKTIISASIGLIASLVGIVMATRPGTITTEEAQTIQTTLPQLITSIVTLAGCLGAIIYRVKANTIIE